ncbi:MAG: WG repeat-containing protein [Mediterranea sp.]|jgi:hypothetical protein|nr:WG repeat-containing protein [Mediterranea sp.]
MKNLAFKRIGVFAFTLFMGSMLYTQDVTLLYAMDKTSYTGVPYTCVKNLWDLNDTQALSAPAQENDTLYLFCPGIEPDLRCEYRNINNETIIPAGKYGGPYMSKKFVKFTIVNIKGMPGFYAIDRTERILFEIFGYDNGPDYVSKGLFRIVENEKMGFANMDGEIVIKPQFSFVGPFMENDFAVFNEGGRSEGVGEEKFFRGGKWGLINKKGEVVIPPIYDSASPNHLIMGKEWFEITDDGKIGKVVKVSK